jgi:CheY-like chemotaxis protein
VYESEIAKALKTTKKVWFAVAPRVNRANEKRQKWSWFSEMPERKLYIADDNFEFAEYLMTVARRLGWTVQTCSNGNELLALLRSGKGAAVVLVDINMPEKDGIEVIEGLSEVSRPLRFRFMTGGADAPMLAAKLMARARNLSVGRNLYKPIPMDTLKLVLVDEWDALMKLEKAPDLPVE